MRVRREQPKPLYVEIGQAPLFPNDEFGGWEAVLHFEEATMELPGIYPTEGAALDALNEWAGKRHLLITNGLYTIKKKNPDVA